VLVVSAAPFAGRFLADTIATTGATAMLATGPDGALALLRQDAAPDAILIDQSIGPDAARALAEAARERGPGERLIMLSPTERRQFGVPREQGFTGFLMKPVRARSLYERLSPRREAAQLLPDSRQDAPSPALPVAPRLTVLVAEDNEINALLATRTLERLGCAAIWARNGREAISHVAASLKGEAAALDLVLLDIRMPELDGLSAARIIRTMEAEAGTGAKLPLIAVSANVSAADRSAAQAAGMDDCLAKPLDRAALKRWLDHVEGRLMLTLSA
jgi:CheY-like chemotaxis protein